MELALEPPSSPAKPEDPDEPEHRVIRAILAATGGHGPEPRLGPGDDAAILADGQVITVDALLEDVHFDSRLSPSDVGFKALAVSVSDLAAMGARPEWAVLALALPREHNAAWTEQFAEGLAEACARWGVRLVGGDTTRSPGPIAVSLTLGGRCVAAPLTRAGARPGDDLWVTGVPGLAAAGYTLREPPPEALHALRRPAPPLALALDLAAAGLVTAAMDLSDGLASDLPRLCRASGCGAWLDEGAMPEHPVLRAMTALSEARALRLAGGDDYQLLFTTRSADADVVRELAAQHQQPVARVGRITVDGGARPSGGAWPRSPFSHFGEVAP